MSTKHMTEEEMDNAGLTDEERAALESDDDIVDTDTGDEPNGADTEAKGKDADDAGDDAGDEPDEDVSGTPEAREDDAPGRDDGKQVEPVQPDARQYTPTIRAELPEDFKEQIDKIGTEKADLRKKYNEGDIDFDEYEQQRDALDEQRRQLEQQQFKASIAQEMREDRWLNHDVAGFMADHPEYKPGSALYAMLDSEVRNLQAIAESEGKEPLDPAILRAAHASIREQLAKDLGLPVGQQARKGTPPASRDVPPTLGNLPAAEAESTDGGRWASLDRLAETDPVAFEERLEAMSDADRDAYLAAR